MGNQALDHSEILSLRWAHDDPNPVAQDAISRADKDALFALLQAKGISMKEAGYEYPAEYSLPAAKRVRTADDVDLIAQHPELAYPDTDHQYQHSAHGQSLQDIPQPQPSYLLEAGSAGAPAATSSVSSSAGEGSAAVSTTKHVSNKALTGWEEHVDADTGATYYYNPGTGESSWGAAPSDM